MKEENENYICALLQGLRWRITRISHAVTRREIVIQYVSNDILSYSITHTLLEKKGERVRIFYSKDFRSKNAPLDLSTRWRQSTWVGPT